MALTSSELNRAIKEFSREISDQPLGLALHRPHPNAQHTNCIANALAVHKGYGGGVVYGWYFLHRFSIEFGDYLIATHHAVWHNPSDLSLVDVTPFHPEQKHKPITQDGDLLFLVDDNAQPFRTGKFVVPLPSKFYAAKPWESLIKYVEKLQREECESYNELHGSSF
ncbi:MAG: hypothetical protein MJA83_03040 [Gammaproteobacteria bacterium]|nr:hypothetical protein [Gammaproteobacteria bacterium]